MSAGFIWGVAEVGVKVLSVYISIWNEFYSSGFEVKISQIVE